MEMEAEKEDLTAQINTIGDDYQQLQVLSEKLSQRLKLDLEKAIDRWAELSEIAEATLNNHCKSTSPHISTFALPSTNLLETKHHLR